MVVPPAFSVAVTIAHVFAQRRLRNHDINRSAGSYRLPAQKTGLPGCKPPRPMN
ncbi:hypothetical protein EG68_11357 [Paragonimus skrjabini miyazakii]|uniref:Uncharacterized protein n=1 Tax=Paragonimus skrjabini miyazakii TaxID=59628 RepID=A0A8S9YEH2_9TREM|nr:hypothetical protein EG68_11357 [Paragonimus skrjabini miyazakii]